MARFHTGTVPGPALGRNPAHMPRTPNAPPMLAQRLLSMGLRVVSGLTRDPKTDGWLVGDCVDRASGEARGKRWIRHRDGRFEVRKERP